MTWSGSAWVDGISAVAGVSSVNGRSGAVTLSGSDLPTLAPKVSPSFAGIVSYTGALRGNALEMGDLVVDCNHSNYFSRPSSATPRSASSTHRRLVCAAHSPWRWTTGEALSPGPRRSSGRPMSHRRSPRDGCTFHVHNAQRRYDLARRRTEQLPAMIDIEQLMFAGNAAPGQVEFLASATWIVPPGVESISMVCVETGGFGNATQVVVGGVIVCRALNFDRIGDGGGNGGAGGGWVDTGTPGADPLAGGGAVLVATRGTAATVQLGQTPQAPGLAEEARAGRMATEARASASRAREARRAAIPVAYSEAPTVVATAALPAPAMGREAARSRGKTTWLWSLARPSRSRYLSRPGQCCARVLAPCESCGAEAAPIPTTQETCDVFAHRDGGVSADRARRDRATPGMLFPGAVLGARRVSARRGHRPARP